jgi:hypothetical protein
MKISDLIVPGVITVFSFIVIYLSLQLDLSPPMIVGDSMQPRAFPIFLMIINLILVGLLTYQFYQSPPDSIPLEPFQAWGSIVLLVIFYGLTTGVVFFVAIAVVMFLMCILWGEKRILVALSASLVTPILIFVLFDQVLQIRFPRGLLLVWYYG